MKLAAALKRIALNSAEAKREHDELRKTINEQKEIIRKLQNSGLTPDQGQLVINLEATTKALNDAIADEDEEKAEEKEAPAAPPADE